MTFNKLVRISQVTYLFSITKAKRLILFNEIIIIYCENHTKSVKALHAENSEFLSVKASGVCSNGLDERVARQQLCKHGPTRNDR
jgi:hypothetical protein